MALFVTFCPTRPAAADHERHAAAAEDAAAGVGVVGLDGLDDVVKRQAKVLKLAGIEACDAFELRDDFVAQAVKVETVYEISADKRGLGRITVKRQRARAARQYSRLIDECGPAPRSDRFRRLRPAGGLRLLRRLPRVAPLRRLPVRRRLRLRSRPLPARSARATA